MTGEELKKAAWKVIKSTESNTTATDEAQADQVLEEVPKLIEIAMTDRRRTATVSYLNERSVKAFDDDEKRCSHNNHGLGTLFNDLFKVMKQRTPDMEEALLVGADRIIFKKLREALLNPFVGKDPANKWGIGIRW